jgi:ATP-dependent phosphoenolpyruvate carboxykinase
MDGWSLRYGKRIDLPSTRKIINAILNKSLSDVPYTTIPVFNLSIPSSVPEYPLICLIGAKMARV